MNFPHVLYPALVMKPISYTAPDVDLPSFHCPHCGAFAQMRKALLEPKQLTFSEEAFQITRCGACHKDAVWRGKASHIPGGIALNIREPKLIYPTLAMAPMPNADMPDDIAATYLEARDVLSASPRAAAALLRLCIQQICVFKGLPGKKLNDDIGTLVSQGLPNQVQMALDAVRVVGNNAVHPGELTASDTQAMASSLFELVNLVAEELISRPKRIEALYQRLPAGALASIERRDASKGG